MVHTAEQASSRRVVVTSLRSAVSHYESHECPLFPSPIKLRITRLIWRGLRTARLLVVAPAVRLLRLHEPDDDLPVEADAVPVGDAVDLVLVGVLEADIPAPEPEPEDEEVPLAKAAMGGPGKV